MNANIKLKLGGLATAALIAASALAASDEPKVSFPQLDWALGLERGDPMQGPWTTNFFSSADQQQTITPMGAGRWRFACCELVGGGCRVAVRVVLDVTRVGGRTTVVGTIENREVGTRVFSFDGPFDAESHPVTERTRFLFPWSNGLLVRRFPSADEKHSTFGYLFARRTDGLWGLNEAKRLEYPSRRCMMQWFTATEGDHGLSYAVKDPHFGAKRARIEFDAVKRTLRFGFEHRLYLHPGESFALPPVEIVRYAGDWHVAARDYGAWLAKARPYAHVPDKVKDCSTLMLLLCKQQNGEMVWPYGDFDKLGDAAIRHGIRHIKILARGPGGHDNLYPDYTPDPAQGGTNALMKGLAELKKRGIETYAYVNGQLIECGTTDYWRTGGGATAGVLQRNGRRAHEAWLKYNDRPAHEFDVACPWDRTWLDKMMAITKEAQYLGFDGMYFDQVAKQWPWQCWATNHGHRPGDWVWTEDRARYLKGIHDELVKSDPDFILTSEGYNETVSDSCSLHLGLGDSSSIRRRFDADACDWKYPEMAFYTIPHLRTSDRYPSPHRSRADISETAIAGYATDIEVRYPCERRVFEDCTHVTRADYGTVNGPPIDFDKALSSGDLKADRDYFKAVNDFRYANREILLRGKYEDTEGFSVKTDAKRFMAKRWTASDGKTFGIFAWNDDDTPAVVTITAEGTLLGASEPEAGTVDPASPVPAHTLRLWRFKTERSVVKHPLVTVRLNALSRPDDYRKIVEINRTHPGSADEYWFGRGGAGPRLEVLKARWRLQAEQKKICEKAGIACGFQQGVTLGHGSIYDPAGGGQAKAELHSFSDAAWQVDKDGNRMLMFCPRSPEVLRYEEEYAAALGETLHPVSLWLDDDLRLGYCKKDGCFCTNCLAAFGAAFGEKLSRTELVARLFGRAKKDRVRRAWLDFLSESLAIYGTAVRRGMNRTNPDCLVAYQSVDAMSLMTGRDFAPLLRALSENCARPTSIRIGSGCYGEDLRELTAKMLGVAFEAERVRRSGLNLSAVSYEQETYRREALHKTPEAIAVESALALACGCDALTEYYWDEKRPEPLWYYEEFAATMSDWRSYFERLAAVARRTSLGGIARFIGGDFDLIAKRTLRSATDLDLAGIGVPVTVMDAGTKVRYVNVDSLAEWGEGDAERLLANGAVAIVDASCASNFFNLGGAAVKTAATENRIRVFDLAACAPRRYPTHDERGAMLDAIDLLAGDKLPVRVERSHPLYVYPRVDDEGRVVTVSFYNGAEGALLPTVVRIRRPLGARAVWVRPCAEDATLDVKASGDELILTLPKLPARQIGTLFLIDK